MGLNHHDPKRIRILVETILYSLVDHEVDVVINEVAGEQNVVFEVKVHDDDFGHILGIGGKNAEAIRTILNAACKKFHVKYSFHVLTKNHSHRIHR